MYYLNPPFLMIDGVAIATDHLDTGQLYFTPASPHLATTTSAEGVEVPRFLLVKYQGDAGNGGVLSFDTSLGISPDRLKEIGAKARDLLGLKDEPRLSPIPFIEGSVKMMLFGQESEVPPADGAPAKPVVKPPGSESLPTLVLKMTHNAQPSMYGDNEAAFSVLLDQAGVVIMEKALAGEIMPIGIIYALSFVALRPAYRVSVKADWDRVQKHFDQHFGGNIFGVFSTSIDKAVDELIESKAIEVEADTFVTDDEDAGSIISNKDQALRQVRDMITDAFFTPSLDPWKEPQDGWDRAAGFLERFAHVNPMGAEDAMFQYNQTDYTRIDKKRLDVTFSERTAVRRTIYPQAHLAGFFRSMEADGIDMDRFVMAVNTNDPWFEKRRVTVFNRSNFAFDGISSVNVHLKYGNEPKNVVFAAGVTDGTAETGVDPTKSMPIEWSSILEGGAIRLPVTVSYDVDFADDVTSTGLRSVTHTLDPLEDNVLEVDPQGAGLYRVRVVRLDVERDYPWDRYSAVEVRLAYRDEDNGVEACQTLVFTQDDPEEDVAEQVWKFHARNPTHTDFTYQLVHRALLSGDVETTWMPSDDDLVTISDPFPQKRRVRFNASFDWEQAERVFVDASYDDKANGIHREESFEFSLADKSEKTFAIDLEDPTVVEVRYSGFVVMTDGRVREIPPSVTRAQRGLPRRSSGRPPDRRSPSGRRSTWSRSRSCRSQRS